jgi:hypothetical protein
MSGRRRRVYVPILYLLVIGALLFLQFGGIETRDARLGELELTVTSSRGLSGDERLRSVEAGYGPVTLRLSSTSLAALDDGSGLTERLRPTAYRVSDGSVAVTLGDKVELTLAADDGRLSVHASPLVPLTVAVELSLPLSLDSSAAVVQGLPLLRVAETGRTTWVSAPADGRLEERRVRGMLRAGSAVEILTVERRESSEDAYGYWFSRVAVPGTREAYATLTAEYLGRCFAAWQAELAAGGVDLVARDSLCTAYLTESLARGFLPQAVGFIAPRVALALNQGARPSRALPAAFIGMPQAYADGARAHLESAAGDIAQRVSAKDLGVFGVPRLFDTALSSGSRRAVDGLLALAATVPVASGSPDVLLDVARFYADVEAALPRIDGVRDRLEEILARRIVPLLARTESGLFFLPSAASGEPLDRTIAAGRLLVDSAGLLARGDLEPVGRRCILSALKLSGPDATLPAQVRMDGTRLVPAADRLPTEGVYELVAEGRYLPAERALEPDVGQGAGTGVWMLSAAKVVGLDYQGGALRLSLSFPQGLPHYVVLQGIPSVSRVELHGTGWRPDAEYYRYTDGWWIAPETRTFALKLTQQAEVEELVIAFP